MTASAARIMPQMNAWNRHPVSTKRGSELTSPIGYPLSPLSIQRRNRNPANITTVAITTSLIISCRLHHSLLHRPHPILNCPVKPRIIGLVKNVHDTLTYCPSHCYSKDESKNQGIHALLVSEIQSGPRPDSGSVADGGFPFGGSWQLHIQISLHIVPEIQPQMGHTLSVSLGMGRNSVQVAPHPAVEQDSVRPQHLSFLPVGEVVWHVHLALHLAYGERVSILLHQER